MPPKATKKQSSKKMMDLNFYRPPLPSFTELPGVPTDPKKISLPYKIPYHVGTKACVPSEKREQWLALLQEAERTVRDDLDFQRRASRGLRIKERRVGADILGRMYTQYCELINKIYDIYTNTFQIQREVYMLEIVAVILKRMYEIHDEIVHYIVSNYIYVDGALIQTHKTPYDIQIVVPYHFPLEAREESVEQMLQKMWKKAIKRKRDALKPKKEIIKEETPMTFSMLEITSGLTEAASEKPVEAPAEPNVDGGDEDEKVGEEQEESSSDDDSLDISKMPPWPRPSFVNCVLIQKHERFRRLYIRNFIEQAKYYRQFQRPKDIVEAPREIKQKAATYVKRAYRMFMEAKRRKIMDIKRKILLGIVPDIDARPKEFLTEDRLLRDRHWREKKKIEKEYEEQKNKMNKRLLWLRKEDLIEDITDEVVQWFKEWYYNPEYGFFPNYPFELEGGTVIVVNGVYPSVEEQIADDERWLKETKGKTKEQLKNERERVKREEAQKAEAARDKARKDKKNMIKARMNPATDPGYNPVVSMYGEEMAHALTKYRQAWCLFDEIPAHMVNETVYGFMKSVLTEDLMENIQFEARIIVDQLMRLEYKNFVKAQKRMYARMEWPWPKMRPRKRPKKPKGQNLVPYVRDHALYKKIEPVFDYEIMSRPTTKMIDIKGDFSYICYEGLVADPHVKFKQPSYGDIRQRLVMSCIFASGAVQPPPRRNKSVLLLGIPHNGKSFMVDAVCGEMNAVKFNISPEVFSAKFQEIAKKLMTVFHAAKCFQPSVIFCKNIERVFYTKVPPAEKKQKAKSLLAPLKKILRMIKPEDKIIFIATCSDPFAAKANVMIRLFNEVIFVPFPDYSSIQQWLYFEFSKMRSMPPNMSTQPLAQCFKGLGFGDIMTVFRNVLDPERIVRLNVERFQETEFIDYIIDNRMEQLDGWDMKRYLEFYESIDSLRAEKETYIAINLSRVAAYETIAKKAAEKKKAKGQ